MTAIACLIPLAALLIGALLWVWSLCIVSARAEDAAQAIKARLAAADPDAASS